VEFVALLWLFDQLLS